MPKSILYTMYAADTIKLVKATLQGTTEPLVPYKTDPLEFCREAHKVKDELVSRAVELLENDIPITEQGDGWISVEEQMPTEDARYLVCAPNVHHHNKPFVCEGWFNPENDLGWTHIAWVNKDAVTHWMPLPEPPSE